MLTGLIRPVDTRTGKEEGEDLAEITEKLKSATPEGWQLMRAPVAMEKRSTALTVEATYVRRDGLEEIEGADMDALRAKVPEGWQLLSVWS